MASVLPDDPERDRSIPGIESLLGGMDIDIDDVEPDDSTVVEAEDGSADLMEASNDAPQTEHLQNLAEVLEEQEMADIAYDLLKKIDNDKDARKKRDQQYEEGIRRTGLGEDAPGGASFEGASRVVHPMLAEGCVDFASSAMKEIFPPSGPVKTKIEGDATQEKLDIAKRQERYLNWQLTEQISEYADELEQTLTQVPMGGSQYMKFWHDEAMGRITCEFVPVDDVYLPYACSDFVSAQRITHVQRLTGFIFEERVESKFYREVEVGSSSEQPEETKTEQSSAKVEGKEPGLENVDDERIVYEVNTFLSLSVDGGKRLPYLISIDEGSKKVLSIYRNWEEDDQFRKRLEWMVEYGFIAWRGAYKIGLPHLIGGLSAAATGSLRALLDSAHINTLPGFLRLKGARLGGQSKTVDPATGIEVDASVAADDIRKLVMALPYNQPSPTLFELLGWLTNAAKGVVTTAEEKISEASNQMPVGTALALIEQGAKVFSSIHARLHRSQRRAFAIIARLNARHMDMRAQVEHFGEIIATKEDFSSPLAVIPISDPNIFSDTQRYAQMQMVLQLAMGQITAPMHDLYAVVRRLYEIAKVPDIDVLLPKPKKPVKLNSAAENSAAMMGSPIIAFPDQDHLAHIEVHLRFVTDPFFGANPGAAPKAMPAIMENVKQHLSFLYAQTMFEIANQALGMDIGEAMKGNKDSEMIDKVLAAASRLVHARLQQMLAPLGPAINQIIQQIIQMQPPRPQDPAQAALMAAKMDSDAKREATQVKAQVDQGKLAVDQGKAKLAAAQDQQKTMLEREKAAHEAQVDNAGLSLDQQKLELERAEAEHKAQIDEAKLAAQIQHQELQLAEAKKSGNDVPGA